jgi:hypothetical protein
MRYRAKIGVTVLLLSLLALLNIPLLRPPFKPSFVANCAPSFPLILVFLWPHVAMMVQVRPLVFFIISCPHLQTTSPANIHTAENTATVVSINANDAANVNP